MIVSINQPAYLPWLGYFDRIARSDLHIVLDHVQFEKNSYTNRNKIRVREGPCWLTVPVSTKGQFGHLEINRIEIAEREDWPAKHWQSLITNYNKAPHFAAHRSFFEKLYKRNVHRLVDLTDETTSYLLDALSIATRTISSSGLAVEGTKSQLVLNLCRKVGATRYLSGPLGRNYLDAAAFAEARIEVVYHDYHHPVYRQVYPGFEPGMSVIDLLFNHGNDSLRILKDEGRV